MNAPPLPGDMPPDDAPGGDPPIDYTSKPAQAWARYQRVMRLMMMLTLLMVGASFVAIFKHNGVDSARFYIATALGVGFAMLLMSALMGLVFLTGGGLRGDAAAQPENEEEDQSAG